jgi:hypothetical protein
VSTRVAQPVVLFYLLLCRICTLSLGILPERRVECLRSLFARSRITEGYLGRSVDMVPEGIVPAHG